jgi:hypothetical protein
MLEDINEKKHNRYKFLKLLYKLSDGNKYYNISFSKLGEKLRFSEEESDAISEYLNDEGLVEISIGGQINITHSGIIEVEQSISQPGKPTKHFPPIINYIAIDKMINSQIQQGTNNSKQQQISSDNFSEITQILNSIQKNIKNLTLDQEAQDELLSEVSTINVQIKSPKPKIKIIEICLQTIRTILEKVAISIIAGELINQINQIIR